MKHSIFQPTDQTDKKAVNGKLVLAILTSLCGGFIAGIPAIIFARKMEKDKANGLMSQYKKHEKRYNISVAISIILALLVLVFILVFGLSKIKHRTGEDDGFTIGDFVTQKINETFYTPPEINLENVDLKDYSTIPFYIKEVGFTLPTNMDFITYLGFSYEDIDIDKGEYTSIEVVNEDTQESFTVTCKNDSDNKAKASVCSVVSVYFNNASLDASLHGLKIGDKEEKITEIFGQCNKIEVVENSESGAWKEWKSYNYQIDGVNIFAEIIVMDNVVTSILFKYELVEKEESTEQEPHTWEAEEELEWEDEEKETQPEHNTTSEETQEETGNTSIFQ